MMIKILRYFFVLFIFVHYALPAQNENTKRAIIIGASTGMGREIAKLLALDGYVVGLAARRIDLLREIQQDISTLTYIQQMDVSKPEEALVKLQELIDEMGGLDLLIVSVTGWHDAKKNNPSWTDAKSILDVDIIGFYALSRYGLDFFERQGSGHFVGFSSIDGIRGVASCPEYSASKAFCSRYMEAKRNYFIQKNIPITVTDIVPGWINSTNDPDYKQKHPKAYWFESLHDASQDIMQAIKDKIPVAYITKRWKQVADIMKTMPDELYNALGGL